MLFNVFYVNRTLLAENSTHFANILNHLRYTSGYLEVKLRDFTSDLVAGWLDVLYQGTFAHRYPNGLSIAKMKEYIDLAHFLGSENLTNALMDALQEEDWEEVHLEWLNNIEECGLANSPVSDFTIETLAYQIVTTSWTAFAADTHATALDFNTDATLDNFISDKTNLAAINRLLAKVDELNKEKDQQTLVRPKDRRDCRWHQHATDEARDECPRNQKNGNKSPTVASGYGG